MKDRSLALTQPAPTIFRLLPEDPFFQRLNEVHDKVATRAFEIFASRGFTDGHDVEDWFLAEAQVLQPLPFEISETDKQIAVRARFPGFRGKDVEVRIGPRCLVISGQREEASEREKHNKVGVERALDQVFRVIDLPAEINPEEVKATLSDGELKITLAKGASGPKNIPVAEKAA